MLCPIVRYSLYNRMQNYWSLTAGSVELRFPHCVCWSFPERRWKTTWYLSRERQHNYGEVHAEQGWLGIYVRRVCVAVYLLLTHHTDHRLQTNNLGTAPVAISLLPSLLKIHPQSTLPATGDSHLRVALHGEPAQWSQRRHILNTLNEKTCYTPNVMARRYFVSKAWAVLLFGIIREGGCYLLLGY